MAGLLDGKVAVVTGTGPNIGGAIARTLADSGARVACIDFMGERAEEAAAGIREAGGEALPLSCDISKPEEVDAAFKKVVETFGGVHILVNNAAANTEAGILDVTLEEWHWVHSIILDGVMLCSQAAARQMVAQGRGGAIVNIASTTGHRGKAGFVSYATAKGGVLQMTRSMAIDLAPHRIRVNSVTPTQTGSSRGSLPGTSGSERTAKPKNIPLGRWGEPDDQAQAVLFLVSPNAGFVTGENINVDGGLLSLFPSERPQDFG